MNIPNHGHEHFAASFSFIFFFFFDSWRSSLWGQWSPTKDDRQFSKPLPQGSIPRSESAEATWECFSFHLCTRIKIVIQSCLTLCDPMDRSPPRLLCPWDFPGKNTGLGSHSLLQGIFPTQELNLSLLPCRRILYHLSRHQTSPTRTRLTFFTSLTQHLRIFHLLLSTGYFSANYKHIYKSLQNVSSSLCSVCCHWPSLLFFFFLNWLLWRNTNIYSIYLFSLRAPFLGSAGMNLHFLASQGSLTPLHAIIGLQLSVLLYPWWCAAVEWNSRNRPDTCDLILRWNDMESLRIMYSFLVCSSRSVSMEAFYPLHAETVLSAGVMKWWCHRNRGHGTRCLMQGPWGRLTAGIQLHITLATISWALFPQVLPEWNASACSGKYSLQTFLFTHSGQQKMDEGASQ